ncbi:MAG: peptide chain release factor N(5)-glutamine methyltransferase [Bacillota bacterium]
MSTNKMTIGEILGKTVPFLQEKGIPNPRLEADLMLAHVLGLPRIKLYSNWDQPLKPIEVQQYRAILVKRVQGCPMAYLTGEKTFMSWDFIVNPAVLIPRPETELLVQAACDLMKGRTGIRGIDVGTGSGAIVVSLAKLLPDSLWQAIDISPEALNIAITNSERLGVSSRVSFSLGDLLQPVLDQAPAVKFDLVVSNPPYIPSQEIKQLQAEVRQEPWLALDGGADGLAVYRRLIPQAAKVLAPGGYLVLEHGYNQRREVEAMLAQSGMESRSFTDLAGWDRILVGHLGKTVNA